ncbi:ribosome maturation factor RimP [Ornithinimicrobium pratense]|uniref:Ribosome maturation factor RimP n=1 Tax=Ornithinimicrobium pratense TaxID=2593973 RepID=A0A5J6V582_9MICO|nr:ribosome maturation factor RimP [Ornithinimicrobium pratense]QFG68928.1 ribosome maturation factor RimP [Ornithinimicrobium pratense]
MDARATTESITQLAADALTGTKVVIDATEVHQAGRRRLVRIFLARDVSDLPEDDTTSAVEPLTLDEVAEATRSVSDALDSSDVMGQSPYTLEVSSAGLDRPLTTRDQFRRNVGRLVKITTTAGTTTTDRLTSVETDGEADLLTLAKTPHTPIALTEVATALVQVEFNRRDGKDD